VIAFLAMLFIVAWVNRLPMATLISNSLVRICMNGIMVLAMVPSIQAGLGLNFGLPIGIIAGLIGLLIAMEYHLGGLIAVLVALVIGIVLASAAGYFYGLLLNRVKGQEMMVGTYAGFSIVSGMCMFWLLAPFKNPEMIWVVGGKGLRVTIALQDDFAHVLDGLGRIKIGSIQISGGLIGTFALACLIVTVFSRTKLGVAMRVAGANPQFAASCGISVEKMRIVGSVASTVLAAAGIVVYAQSFGFVQLYLAPLMMAFPAVAAVLLGGATTRQATVWNAVLGTFLFQTLLTVALPVTQSVLQGDISEVARLIISNGMILYALTREEAGRR